MILSLLMLPTLPASLHLLEPTSRMCLHHCTEFLHPWSCFQFHSCAPYRPFTSFSYSFTRSRRSTTRSLPSTVLGYRYALVHQSPVRISSLVTLLPVLFFP